MESRTMIRAIVLAIVLYCATTDAIDYQDCGSETGTVSQVELTPCSTEPCEIKRGSSASLQVKFTPKVSSTKFTSQLLYAIVAGEGLNIPNQVESMSAAITANNEVTYSNTVNVLSAYPTVSLSIYLKIYDDNDKALVCVEWPIQIVD